MAGDRVDKIMYIGNIHKNAAGISCKSLFLKCVH